MPYKRETPEVAEGLELSLNLVILIYSEDVCSLNWGQTDGRIDRHRQHDNADQRMVFLHNTNSKQSLLLIIFPYLIMGQVRLDMVGKQTVLRERYIILCCFIKLC
jgi:hypothetical protein